MLVKGELDIAALPANLAAVLYQNMEQNLSVLAINTLGVIYIVEDGDTVQSVADLKGKTIYLSLIHICQYFLCHCHSHKKSLLLCTKRDRCDKLSCGTCPCCFNYYLFCDEMAYLIQTVDSADQSVDGSQNDVFMHTYAPVNFAVGISNGNISSCTGVGFCFQRMFCISYEGIVEACLLYTSRCV